jgi:hypothetical protein
VLIRGELGDRLHGDVGEGTNIISSVVEIVTRLWSKSCSKGSRRIS